MGFQKGNNEDKGAFSSHRVETVGRRYDLSSWMVTLTPWPRQASQVFDHVSPLYSYFVPSTLHSWERSRHVQLMHKEWEWQYASSMKAGNITQYMKSYLCSNLSCSRCVFSYSSINADQLYIKKWLPSSIHIFKYSQFLSPGTYHCHRFQLSLSMF